MPSEIPFLRPEWPAPPHVHALVTTRSGGVSRGPYSSLNLGDHVGDDMSDVEENRARVAANLPSPPLWLKQVHGTEVAVAARSTPGCEADAAVTRERGRVLAVLTADCLPVLLCDAAGDVAGIAHAGWRGLCAGVIEQTLAAMDAPSSSLMAWLGPAIGPEAFEVGDDVRGAFLARDAAAAPAFRRATARGKWHADLYSLARRRLATAGVAHVFGGGFCTVSEPQRFFSHRRDRVTGRMASLVWLSA